MSKEQKSKSVPLPAELYRKVEEKAKATGFGSAEEYVRFVLEEVLKEDEGKTDFTEEEEEEVKKRLRGLGYLD